MSSARGPARWRGAIVLTVVVAVIAVHLSLANAKRSLQSQGTLIVAQPVTVSSSVAAISRGVGRTVTTATTAAASAPARL